MMKYFFLFFLFLSGISLSGRSWYLSPDGNDGSSGEAPENALKTIQRAMELARAGDSILLLPGTYSGTNALQDRHGMANQPITIRSFSGDPHKFAIIDGMSEPSSDASGEGFVLRQCSWINLENLVFRNCWTHVIQLYDSPYISIRGCHFSTGKRIIHAIGHDTHHTLVEYCYVRHPDAVWKGWSWESLHHGEVGYYNGALLHPNASGGGHIMRYNTIVNMFNAFRTRPKSIVEDGNIEIYGNYLVNIRDNEFEPESFAWNMHYYHNDHINIHKMFSIDGVEGGNIYIYGNTYTQTTDPWAMEEISGIFKYKNGPITSPCYAFNNSYYTEAKVLRLGESTNHLLKHWNNAYEFFSGSSNFVLSAWQPGFEFDYDCINQDWPEVIHEKNQEKHGLANTLPGFTSGIDGQFALGDNSPCRDAGKIVELPEFDWVQSYEGSAPDIGAFEGNTRIDGPAFRFVPSPEGAFYKERPRISKHKVEDQQVRLFFSGPLDSTTFDREDLILYQNGEKVTINTLTFDKMGYSVLLQCDLLLSYDNLTLDWINRPIGNNGQELTDWGSSISPQRHLPIVPDLSSIAIPADIRNDVPAIEGVQLVVDQPTADEPRTFRIVFEDEPDMKYVNHIAIYKPGFGELTFAYEPEVLGNEVHFQNPERTLEPGTYQAKTRVGKQIITTEFEVK